MQRCLCVCVVPLVVLLGAARGLAGDAATWSFGVGEGSTVAKALTVAKNRITVDLSALPKDAKVFRAVLSCSRRDYRPHMRPADKLGFAAADEPGKLLELMPPRYVTLDATAAAARTVEAGKGKVEFIHKSGRHWLPDKTRLSVSFTGGKAKNEIPKLTGLAARHRDGQTLLTWQEIDPATQAEKITIEELRAIRKGLGKTRRVGYRVYRSTKPITTATIAEAELAGGVGQLTCWNRPYYGQHARYDKDLKVGLFRYVVDEGKGAVPVGTAIFAHNPPPVYEDPKAAEDKRKEKVQKAYYAVTAVVNGEEDFSKLATVGPVEEKSGDGPFILQRTLKGKTFQYVKNATLNYYVRWEGPPRCNRPGVPYDYLAAVPSNLKKPAPLQVALHCWGGSLNGGYGGWHGGRSGYLMISTNQIPYDWWVSYHERLYTQKCWADGVCRDFTIKRLLGFLDWVKTKWQVDESRVFTKGGSMGGAGASMIALRYPKRFAFAISSVGVHNAAKSPTFHRSYQGVVGLIKHGLKHESGLNVWDYLSNSHLLRKDPARDTPLICFGNGKDDGGIGWAQALDFAKACQETRQPHTFGWNLGGHTARVYGPGADVRLGQSVPAFTKCSLDGNPGTAAKLPKVKEYKDGKYTRKDPWDGDSYGQLNAYLRWQTKDLVDEEGKWKITVFLSKGDRRGRGGAPKDQCAVDITPRRCQTFKPKPGDKFKWTNTQEPRLAGAVEGAREVQSGTVTADKWGLVTLDKAVVTKGKNRIKITKE